MATPPIRMMITTVQTHSREEMKIILDRALPGVAAEDHRNLHMKLSAFLLSAAVLSGVLCGITSVFMKLSLMIAVYAEDRFENTMLYLCLFAMVTSAVLNFLNLT